MTGRTGCCQEQTAEDVTEAENRLHELFGEERLSSCLSFADSMSSSEIIAAVKAAIDEHVGEYDQFDDITMLCLTYNGPESGD